MMKISNIYFKIILDQLVITAYMEIEIKNTIQSLKVRFESWFLFNSVKSIVSFDTIIVSEDSDTFSFI